MAPQPQDPEASDTTTAPGLRLRKRAMPFQLRKEQCPPYACNVSSAPQVQADLVELTLGCFHGVAKLPWEGTARPDHGCGMVKKANE